MENIPGRSCTRLEHLEALNRAARLSLVQPGLILSQTGFGLGLISSCIALMKQANLTKSQINRFLDDQVVDIEADFLTTHRAIYRLANEIGCGGHLLRADILKDVIEVRIAIAELSLRTSQATMLHLGSSGYRLHSTAERKLRESYFVAVVTPSLKHLKKLHYEMNGGSKDRYYSDNVQVPQPMARH
jgi:hypothetical protein